MSLAERSSSRKVNVSCSNGTTNGYIKRDPAHLHSGVLSIRNCRVSSSVNLCRETYSCQFALMAFDRIMLRERNESHTQADMIYEF